MKHKSIDQAAVIVPNWNGASEISDCLMSLRSQSYPLTIIVVDNGSIDNSIDIIKSKFPDVILLKQPKNLGFAGGVNRGIEYCLTKKFKYIGLFNNDAIADKNWLGSLVSVFVKDPQVGIVTGLLLRADGKTIDSTGEQYSTWGLPFPRNRNMNAKNPPKSGATFGATGGATLYSAELFNDIGLFDEDFFAYYEDVDISFRAQLAGWKIMYESEAIAYHQQGATSNKLPGFTVFQTFKNLPLLFWKNVPLELIFSVGLRFYLALILMYLHTFVQNNILSASKGIFISFILLPKALRKRYLIQKDKRVSSQYIKDILWSDLPPDQTGLRRMRKLFTGK